MAPEKFMAHRVVQLALMNLASTYNFAHPSAEKEKEDADMGTFFHSHLAAGCRRSEHCSFPAAQKSLLRAEGTVLV